MHDKDVTREDFNHKITISNDFLDFFKDTLLNETLTTPVITLCGHTFDNDSISYWLSSHSDCPGCKSPSLKTDLNINAPISLLLQEIKKQDSLSKLLEEIGEQDSSPTIEINDAIWKLLVDTKTKNIFKTPVTLFCCQATMEQEVYNDVDKSKGCPHCHNKEEFKPIINYLFKSVCEYLKISLFREAIANKNQSEIATLLQQEPNLADLPLFAGDNALMHAVKNNDDALLQRLFQYKIDINKRNSKDETAFYLACSLGYKDIVNRFLKRPDLDVISYNKMQSVNAEEIASLNGRQEIVDLFSTQSVLFLKALCYMQHSDIWEACNVLSEVYRNYQKDIFLRQLYLIKNKFTELSNGLITQLHSMIIESAIKNNHIAVFDALLPSQIFVDLPFASGETPLHIATRCGHVDFVEHLLELGADPNITHVREKHIPLSTSASKNDVLVAKALIKYGANMADTSWKEQSPFITAIDFNSVETLRLFLDQPNAPVNTKFKEKTPLMLAVIKNKTEILKLLLQDPHLNINEINENGNTAIAVAATRGNIEHAKLLLQHPKIDLEIRNCRNLLPEQIAVENGHHEFFALFTNPDVINIRIKNCLEKNNLKRAVTYMIELYRNDLRKFRESLTRLSERFVMYYQQVLELFFEEMIDKLIKNEDWALISELVGTVRYGLLQKEIQNLITTHQFKPLVRILTFISCPIDSKLINKLTDVKQKLKEEFEKYLLVLQWEDPLTGMNLLSETIRNKSLLGKILLTKSFFPFFDTSKKIQDSLIAFAKKNYPSCDWVIDEVRDPNGDWCILSQ